MVASADDAVADEVGSIASSVSTRDRSAAISRVWQRQRRVSTGMTIHGDGPWGGGADQDGRRWSVDLLVQCHFVTLSFFAL